MKQFYGKKHGKSLDQIKGHTLSEDEEKEAREALVAAENALPYSKKNVDGDASETGLIRFAQLIMDLEETRGKHPIFSFDKAGKKVDAKIPFSSEHKFNLFIRDLNKVEHHPASANDNLVVVMKGAPEKIINRCGKILINGEEKDFDENLQREVNLANASLGKLGERVLALATYKLDPSIFTKTPAYPFDTESWKQW
jgi:sodium/potassium-transporting ATPase subunit alpha